MTKVKINPGICGFITTVEAESEDGIEVKIKIKSGCPSVNNMLKDIGDELDAFEVCLAKPGQGPLYE